VRLGHGASVWAAAGGALALIAGIGFLTGTGGDTVATMIVSRGRFVREVTATGILRATKTTPVTASVESYRAQKIASLAPDGSRVKAGEVVVRFDPYDAEKEAADGRSDAGSASAKLLRATTEGEKTDHGRVLDRDLAREDLKRAEEFVLTDEGIFSRNQRIESEIDRDLQKQHVETTTALVGAGGRLVASDKALADIEKQKAALRVRQATQSLGALQVTAPHDGLFVHVRDWRGDPPRVGQTFFPGQKIGEIPDLSTLEALVWVLESDASELKTGVGGTLAIEGKTGSTTDATVTRVEAIARPRQTESPVKYFETTLSLARTDPSAAPGQFVKATLRIEERADVIAIPRGALFEKDGQRVVYRSHRGGFEPVGVVVGANSISRVVVESGLSPGDRIALRDPLRGVSAAASPQATSPGAEPGSAP
jgi:HlyD family secretion protein